MKHFDKLSDLFKSIKHSNEYSYGLIVYPKGYFNTKIPRVKIINKLLIKSSVEILFMIIDSFYVLKLELNGW